MPSTLEESSTANAEVLRGWLNALENWDLQRIMDPFDETAVQQILPASLGRPPKNKQEYEAHIREMMPIFEKFKVSSKVTTYLILVCVLFIQTSC